MFHLIKLKQQTEKPCKNMFMCGESRRSTTRTRQAMLKITVDIEPDLK